MATKVEIPSMGESVTEATLLKWAKTDGDRVQVDEPLCELETDKANVSLPSPAAGILRRTKKEGDTVRVGEVIAQIEEGGASASAGKKGEAASSASAATAARPATPPPIEKPAPAAPTQSQSRTATPAKPASSREDLSPSVRRLVEENNLNPAQLAGTGPHGRLLKEDVLKQMGTKSPAGAGALTGQSTASPTGAPFPPFPPIGNGPSTSEPLYDNEGIQRQPMTKIRKKIAERLVAAQHQAAMLTTFNEIDMTEVLALRAKYKDRFQEVHGVGLGLMSFFARAVVLALKQQPIVNASIDANDIVFHQNVHLGIAVSTERGLIVPVLRHADRLSMAKIESEIKRMATAAREGKLGLQELSGGTFTITNGGVFGSLLSTPILNSPQSAILGMHAIQKRPVAVGDKVEVHPMMYVALSYDHRLIDGKDSVTFLVRVKEYLEDPARLMLEV